MKRYSIITLFVLLSLLLMSTSASMQSSGPRLGRVTVIRDEYGVPHVYGSTLESLWFGVGYAQGQDRLWQAEVLRRTATGTSVSSWRPEAGRGWY